MGPNVHIANVLWTSVIQPPYIAAIECWPEGDHNTEVPLYRCCYFSGRHAPPSAAGKFDSSSPRSRGGGANIARDCDRGLTRLTFCFLRISPTHPSQMAARHQLRALRNHPGLNRFCIPSEKITCRDRQIGAGSYGRVVELNIDGTICAGKIMHEVLIQGKEILQKYVEECQLMSDIRHPNIVQFLGLCFLPNSSVPVLVLERLLTSFDDLLDKKPKEENRIPLCIKRSILADVAKGLIYLHNRNPPVIHRDLSARNVLLNSSMQAKISDLGNARIIDFRLAQRSMSRMPGAPTYMPPEAFGDKSQCYGPQLDSFSFGHLTLFAVTQVSSPHSCTGIY